MKKLVKRIFRRPINFVKKHAYKLMASYLLSVFPLGFTTTALTTKATIFKPETVMRVYKKSGIMNMVSGGLYQPLKNGTTILFGEMNKTAGKWLNWSDLKKKGNNMIKDGQKWFDQ